MRDRTKVRERRLPLAYEVWWVRMHWYWTVSIWASCIHTYIYISVFSCCLFCVILLFACAFVCSTILVWNFDCTNRFPHIYYQPKNNITAKQYFFLRIFIRLLTTNTHMYRLRSARKTRFAYHQTVTLYYVHRFVFFGCTAFARIGKIQQL